MNGHSAVVRDLLSVLLNSPLACCAVKPAPNPLWIIRILPLPIIRPGIRIHDLSYALDVHHLAHRLAARGYGDHVVAGLDEISGPHASESAAFTATTTSLTDRRLGGAQIDFARGSPALPTPTSSRAAGRSISAPYRAH